MTTIANGREPGQSQLSEGGRIPDHVPGHLVYDFDYFLASGTERPQSVAQIAREIHNSAPDIFYTGRNGGHWVVTRAADAREVSTNHDLFSSAPVNNEWKRQTGVRLVPVHYDPPEHAAMRRVAGSFFTPARMKQMEEEVRDILRRDIDKFKDEGKCRFVAQLACRFPVAVFLNIVGAPIDDLETLSATADLYLRSPDRRDALANFAKMQAYVEQVIEDRKEHLGTDLVSHILSSELPDRRLTDDEVLGAVQMIFLAGLDTVASAMSSVVLHLADNPDKYAKLVADPSGIPGAVEELLRVSAPATLDRAVTRDFEYKGVPFRKGDRVVLLTQVWGYDEFNIPEAFDIRFERRFRQLAFGTGAHICLGMHLARMELKLFLEELTTSIPTFSLEAGERPRLRGGNVWGYDEIRLVWPVAEHA